MNCEDAELMQSSGTQHWRGFGCGAVHGRDGRIADSPIGFSDKEGIFAKLRQSETLPHEIQTFLRATLVLFLAARPSQTPVHITLHRIGVRVNAFSK